MRIPFFLYSVLILAVCSTYSIAGSPSDRLIPEIAQAPDSIAPDSTEMRMVNSMEFAKNFGRGWNVGNSLEATGGETAWGNPLISQRLIDSIKAAGFGSIRIPVAWSKFTDTATYAIDTNWLARVETVINYALQDSLYVIINEHWDRGWMQPTYSQQEYVNNRLAIIWKQIAIRFRDYGDYLIFAGSNEVMVDGDYGTPTAEYYTVQNSFNQTFVNAVRSTGGRNFYRYLAVQGFNTNIDHTVNFFEMPEDVVEKRLIVEVHYYDPYNFTINTNSTLYVWGDDAPGSESWANETWADTQFNRMKTNFVDNGYGVIIGEYGAQARLNLGTPSLNHTHAVYRLYYTKYITRSIVAHGLIPFVWDNGYTGNNAMGLFDRATGNQAYPDIIDAIIDTSNVIIPVSAPSISENKPTIYPNPSTGLLNIDIPDQQIQKAQLFDLSGKMIKAIRFGESIQPIDISDLQPGIYLLEITTPGATLTQKVIKN